MNTKTIHTNHPLAHALINAINTMRAAITDNTPPGYTSDELLRHGSHLANIALQKYLQEQGEEE